MTKDPPDPAQPIRSWSWASSLTLFAIATVGEFLGLFYWRKLFGWGQIVGATLVLWGGFLVERAVVIVWLQLPRQVKDPFGDRRPLWFVILLVTVAEIVTWVVWIGWSGSFALGVVLLAIGIHVVHAYEVAVIRRSGFASAAADIGTIGLTALEAGSAAFWLYWTVRGRPLLGAAALLAGLLAEHTLQVAALKKKQDAAGQGT